MKLTNVLLALAIAFFATSCGDDDEYGTPIDLQMCNGEIILESERINQQELAVGDIPMDIRNYIASELSGFGLVSGISYQDQNNELYYLVQLNNDGQLLFDSSSNFMCAEGDYNTGEDEYLSYDQLPQKIKDYLDTNYPGIGIDEAEFDDGEYKIKLDNGVELCFDQLGEFIGNC